MKHIEGESLFERRMNLNLMGMEPGKSRWGDAIWTFIIGAMVAYLFAWGAGIIQ